MLHPDQAAAAHRVHHKPEVHMVHTAHTASAASAAQTALRKAHRIADLLDDANRALAAVAE
mgnify:CR=1 FL=1